MDAAQIVEQAKLELASEDLRAAIDDAKERIKRKRAEPLWRRLFPFTIRIERRT